MNFEKEYILTNITIIDGVENTPQPDMYLKVIGRNIEAIGRMEDYHKDGCQEVDLAGYFVMPGLIDAHIHMAGGRGGGEWGDTEILCEPAPVRHMRSIYEAQKMLKSGFTTVRDISWNSLYMKRIFTDDTLPGPKVIACGPGLARTGGHCDSPQFPIDYVKDHHFWAIIADGEDECRRAVRQVLREGADQIKFWATGGGNWGTDRIDDTHYSQEEMNIICREAHLIKGTKVCAHCETEETIRMAIEAGVDTIEHGEDLTPELCDMMIERDIILVPTLFLLAKSIVLLNTERYEECIEVSEHMIELCDSMPEPYYHIATCKLNQALELEKIHEPRKYRSKLQQLYREARPYMEDYRRMVPGDMQRWGPALYRIYFNLNLGRQFEEIDRLLRNH